MHFVHKLCSRPIFLHRLRKKESSILGIASSNIGRFSKFLHDHSLLEICNKATIKYPTTPKTRRYTRPTQEIVTVKEFFKSDSI